MWRRVKRHWRGEIHIQAVFAVKFRQALILPDFKHELFGYMARWINEQGFLAHEFEWQKGYGAFSYGKSQVGIVYKYVQNQEKHHQKRSFREEYLEYLQKFEIQHDEKYIFRDPQP